MASSASQTSAPVVRRPDTGCTCKCIPAKTDEEIQKLADTATRAFQEGMIVSEKPTIAVAMLLLGGDVVYR
ncbi:hypothetical protein F4778DRAFT_787568 [Xylariomycetidae sp. FL2044]|nr:hypothetical protein F4778DRAFT_787568 [Xylariomycetidae sp. FL2044]